LVKHWCRVFDDGSPNPFALHALPEYVNRVPAKSDEGQGDFTCLVYIGREGNPVQSLTFSAGYRRVQRIPWLKALKRRMR
jgi:hypothetical protein